MKQENVKYIYEIESTLDLDDVIGSLKSELKLEEGILNYFSLSEDGLLEEKLQIDELKTKAVELNSRDEYPSLTFPNIDIHVDGDKIQIVSKIKLKLNGVDVDKVIEK